MKRKELEKLLGGYATGNLGEQERRALFEAALSDQEIFDALADEEALREMLEDPGCRRRLIEALQADPEPWFAGLLESFRRPRGWAMAAGAASTIVLAVMMVRVAVPERGDQEMLLASNKDVAPSAPAAGQSRSQLQSEPPSAPAESLPKAAPQRNRAKRAPTPQPPAKPEPAELAPPPERQVYEPVARPLLAEAPVLLDAPQQLADAAPPVPAPGMAAPFAAAERSAARMLTASARAHPLLVLRYSWEREPVRLSFEANQRAFAYVIAGGRLLFSVLAEPRKRYLVDVPPAESGVSVILSRQAQARPLELSTPPDQRSHSAEGEQSVFAASEDTPYLRTEMVVR